MKKLAQPTRSFFTLKISWKSSPGWLQLVFHFGTENRADQLKNHPVQERVHQSIAKADTGLPWSTWCWNSSLVYSFIIKLQVSGSSWWGCCRMEVQPEEIDQISDISRIPRISSFSEIKYHECKVGSLCEWGFPRVWRWNVRRLMFLACSNAP